MIWLPVSLQGRQILTAVGLGLSLGGVYDLLRGFRRIRPGCTWLMDLIFGLLLLISLLWFMLYPGLGMLRGYDLLAVCAGAVLWFWGLGPVFLPAWMAFLRGITAFFQQLFRPLTNIFHKAYECVRKERYPHPFR